MSNFRKSFSLTGKRINSLNWFPKHMNSGLKQMQAKIRSVDCVVEVHDARIPLSGRNPNLFRQMVGPDKPHILIMNKSDLISEKNRESIVDYYASTNTVSRVLFTNCKNDLDPGIKKLVPLMKSLIESSTRYHRENMREYQSMIMGIPNVGKSSLINMLRSRHLKKGRALKVGPSAGVTKCVHEKVKISETPLIYLFDTPGILQPRVSSINNGLKLAACGNLPDAHVGNLFIADFILFSLNKAKNFKYLKYIGLCEPNDSIAYVLSANAVRRNFISKIWSPKTNLLEDKPDLEVSSIHFISAFRRGLFGSHLFDDMNKKENQIEDEFSFRFLPEQEGESIEKLVSL